MEEDRIILEGCEVGCIPVESELIACPLSEGEARECPRRLGYLRGVMDIAGIKSVLRQQANSQAERSFKMGYNQALKDHNLDITTSDVV